MPSGSLNIADVPYASVFGGPANPTPQADSSSYDFLTLSLQNTSGWRATDNRVVHVRK